jgi:glycosyl hydrolase family 20
MYANLLPLPRSMSPRDGACVPNELTRGVVCGLTELSLELLAEELPRVDFRATPGGTFTAVLSREADSAPVDGEPPDQEQGFLLRVEPQRVVVIGRDAAGLWYGLQTWLQLVQLAAGAAVPAAEIRDWPAIRYRGIHLDLKGYQPRFERLLEMLRLLSRFRINAVLLEVEDKYAYSCAPEVGVPGAFTAPQFHRLGEVAAALSIQIIPKLQCLGHVDYLLRHERYRNLRENGHPFQFCPRNEEGMALWRDMAGELCECFPGHRFFHVGADESGNLGECPVCREYSKASSYVHRVQQSLDVVTQAGRQPIMWDDILRNLHGNLDQAELERTWVLGDEAVLMYWAYGYGGQDNAFGLLPRYLERDLQVWGASGFSGCGPSWTQNIPVLQERALNIAAWTKTAVEQRLEGVVATGWTRIASADPPAEAPELCWFPMLYAAESTWCGEGRALDAFCRVASRAVFGTDISPWYGAYLMSMEADDLPTDRPGCEVTHQTERFVLLQAAAAVDGHDRKREVLAQTLQQYHGRLGARMPDYRIGMVRGRMRELSASLEACRCALERALGAFYEEASVAEVITSRFGRDDQLLAEATRLMDATEQE